MVEGECEEQGGGMVEGQREEQGGGMTESVVVLEERVKADDVVEGEIQTEFGGGECEQDSERQCKVASTEGERGQCDGMNETVVVSEARVEADDVVEGEIQTGVGGGECEQDSERQCEVAGNEGERGQCDGMTETVVVSEERVEADDVVEGEIETQVGVGEVEEDAWDVRSWTSSGGDDGNDEVNYDCMEGLVDVNVECDLEDEVGDRVEDWFGNVQVDVQSDDSDVDDGMNSDHHRGFDRILHNEPNQYSKLTPKTPGNEERSLLFTKEYLYTMNYRGLTLSPGQNLFNKQLTKRPPSYTNSPIYNGFPPRLAAKGS
ncbi:hypothetical protein LR48_Vigan02g088100 [Vigna angularis]|uniref:Uncharacterized protein n=1 Tax=Phaseolus angularis TaxID=3914 RepID=A0A0L9TW73_PHAAN|nr:hypothetical protein LR48_Vigan02g088100 [Vigna angularis]